MNEKSRLSIKPSATAIPTKRFWKRIYSCWKYGSKTFQ